MNIEPCPVCKAEATWRGNVVDGWISCETSGCIIGGTFLNTDEGQAAAAVQWNVLASAARLASERQEENERLRAGIEDTLAAGKERWDCYLSRDTMLEMLAALLGEEPNP